MFQTTSPVRSRFLTAFRFSSRQEMFEDIQVEVFYSTSKVSHLTFILNIFSVSDAEVSVYMSNPCETNPANTQWALLFHLNDVRKFISGLLSLHFFPFYAF